MAMAMAEDQIRLLSVIKAFTDEAQASARYRAQLRLLVDLARAKRPWSTPQVTSPRPTQTSG